MTHTIGNVQLYATHHGQGLILLSLTILACILWAYTANS
ncbi:putative membrane protein [Acinetobacter baumannii 42057_4]|nr:putative membrane protein [Acinetobacter baumannii 42057_4]